MQYMSGETDNWNKNSSGKTVCKNHMLNDNWSLVGITHAKNTEFERLYFDINSC